MGGGYKHLLDVGLHLAGGGTEHLRTSGYRAQVHQRQPLALYLLNHHAQNLLLLLFLFGQEYQARAVLSLLGHGDALQQDKLMGNLHHDACAVARLVACLGTTVLHVLQHF